MVEEIEYVKCYGFKIPKGTSDTIINHLYVMSRHGAVIYRPSPMEDVSVEFKSVAHSIGITIFQNECGYCFINEKGAGGNKAWMA